MGVRITSKGANVNAKAVRSQTALMWAAYANLRPNRPAMDMSMRVTSGNTPFPVVIARVERAPIRGTVVYTGSVAPFNEEDIYPRVPARASRSSASSRRGSCGATGSG